MNKAWIFFPPLLSSYKEPQPTPWDLGVSKIQGTGTTTVGDMGTGAPVPIVYLCPLYLLKPAPRYTTSRPTKLDYWWIQLGGCDSI